MQNDHLASWNRPGSAVSSVSECGVNNGEFHEKADRLRPGLSDSLRKPPELCRLLIIDDQPVTRYGLLQLFRRKNAEIHCEEFSSHENLFERLDGFVPDLVIMDLALSGISGFDLLKQLQQRLPNVPILVFSNQDELVYAERVLRLGAHGYIMKQQPLEEILHAIGTILNGEVYVSTRIQENMLKKLTSGFSAKDSGLPVACLSDRELEVFELLGQGYSTRQIAERLGLSIKTIETYRESQKKKLHLKSGAELLRHAIHWNKEVGGRPAG